MQVSMHSATAAPMRAPSASEDVVASAATASAAASPFAVPRVVNAQRLQRLLCERARRPDYGVSQALAGVLAQSWAQRGLAYLPLFGLDGVSTHGLLADHFPGARAFFHLETVRLLPVQRFAQAGELQALVDMLVQHLTVDDLDGRHLAHAIATACLGDNALWQDMLLGEREALSTLLRGFFTSLAVRNRCDMRWKPFLYQQLRERELARGYQAPRRGGLCDDLLCFDGER